MDDLGNNTYFGGTLKESVITPYTSLSTSSEVRNALNNNKYAVPTSSGQRPSLQDYNKNTNGYRKIKTGGMTGYDWSKAAGLFGQAAQIGTSLFGEQYDDPGYQDEQAAAKFASNFGPWGQFAAGMASISSQATRKLGADTNKISNRAADAAGVSGIGKFGNNTLSWINNTSFGLWGGFGAIPKTQDYNMSQEAEQLSGAYAGTTGDMRAAQDVAGSRFFFGRGKLNNLVDSSVKNDTLLSAIGLDNNNRISSVPYNASDIASRNFRKFYGMNGQTYETRAGKHGMKLLSREELDKIYSAKRTKESDISKLQNGGSILIPDGKLHAHKHHMEDENPELAEKLTKKGIPVITTDSEGEIKQVAEIEKQEIILEKSLTEKIEELWKDGSEEAMIEAGKLIVETLFTNCDDNANLVEEVKYEEN